jgi:hypothetical protein
MKDEETAELRTQDLELSENAAGQGPAVNALTQRTQRRTRKGAKEIRNAQTSTTARTAVSTDLK